MKKRSYVIFILAFLQFATVSSQNEKETSQQLYEVIVDNTRLKPKLAIAKAKQLLSLGRKRKSLDTIAISYLYLAKAGRVAGTYKEALEYADLGLKFAKINNLPNAILAELYLAKANNLSDSGNNDKALPLIFLGVDLAKKSESLPTKVVLNHGLGYILLASERSEEAIKVLKENISFIEENQLLDKKSFEVYYKGMLLLSRIYSNQGEREKAVSYLNEGLKHVLTTEDAFTTIGFYAILGEVYLDDGKYDKAYQNLKKAKEFSAKVGNKNTTLSPEALLARYYYEIGKYKESIVELDMVLSRFENNDEKNLISPEVFKILGKSHKALGNFKEANKYFEEYIINFKNSTESQKSLVFLMQEKRLNDLELEKERQRSNAQYLIIGGSILIILLLLYIVKLAQKRKKDSLRFNELLAKIETKELTVTSKQSLTEKSEKIAEVNEETVAQILEGLQKLEQQQYFLKVECSLHNTAKKIKTNTTYLSKVVNSHFQKSFNNYTNDLRINYAVLKLKEDTRFRNYAIKSIALELGYKSADSFAKYFKLNTGLLPSVYIKKLNNLG